MLKAYAKKHRTTCPAAVHRMVKEALKQFKSEQNSLAKAEPKNQLNIFDSIQVDIFNGIRFGVRAYGACTGVCRIGSR